MFLVYLLVKKLQKLMRKWGGRRRPERVKASVFALNRLIGVSWMIIRGPCACQKQGF